MGDLNTFPVIDVELSGIFDDNIAINGVAEEGENIIWTLSISNVGQVSI